MRPLRLMIAGLLLGLTSSGALAFEETKGGVAVGQQSGTQGGLAPKMPLELGTPDLPAGKSEGTEIRIPGLGKLGTLPKLDFGLELLYGVNEEKDKSVEADKGRPDASEEGVQIRGTFKHRF